MEKMELELGDVVQLNPMTVHNKMLAACFMTVTELKDARRITVLAGKKWS